MVKRLLMFLFAFLVLGCGTSCASNEPLKDVEAGNTSYFDGKKILIAYFSWGGTTQRMAGQIQDITGGDIFRIEPVVPYPNSYTPCTEGRTRREGQQLTS